MRNLISELLDFRKLEQGHMKLKVYEQDIVPFLKEIYLSFYEYASSRSITYNFTAPQENVLCYFDPKQMQKVFYNLLSNAFKYTKPNAAIEMILENKENEVTIKVIDNGIGISKVIVDLVHFQHDVIRYFCFSQQYVHMSRQTPRNRVDTETHVDTTSAQFLGNFSDRILRLRDCHAVPRSNDH